MYIWRFLIFLFFVEEKYDQQKPKFSKKRPPVATTVSSGSQTIIVAWYAGYTYESVIQIREIPPPSGGALLTR